MNLKIFKFSKDDFFNQNLSLQYILIIPFVLQIFTAVGLVGYLSFKNSQKAVNNLADQLFQKTAAIVNQHLDTYLSIPHHIIEMNAAAIQLGLLDVRQPKVAGQYFWKQMQAYDLTYIGYGLTTGEGAGAARYDGKTVVIDEWGAKLPNNTHTYATDHLGNRTKLIAVSDYDLFNQSWYTDPIKAGKPIWSKIYVWENPIAPFITISAGRPIYDANNRLLGMTAADIHLLKLSEFLRKANLSQKGHIFIIERDGFLVANSDSQKPYKQVNGVPQRLKATESSNPIVREMAQKLEKSFLNDFRSVTEEKKLKLTLNQEIYYLNVLPWKDEHGLDWLLIISIPEEEFMAQINANTRLTILLCFGALVGAIVIGIITSKLIAYPLQRLNGATQKMAEGNLELTVEKTRIVELQTLAESFNTMAAQLRNYFLLLEKTNSELEDRVSERTIELKKALNELQRTQAHIVHSEKMSSLGQLVAGVAHEINNPVNFIHGNIIHLHSYIEALLEMLQLYQKIYPHSHPELEELAEKVDLDFIIEDLQKMLASMKFGSERIRNIVLSLRNFARMDESPVKDVNIHEGLENTLMLLQNKFKSGEAAANITVIKEYGELPNVECYAGQLNQVFMNLIINAIEALEEKYIIQKKQDIIPEPGILKIQTQLISDEWIRIHIYDTGLGIENFIIKRLFDPFFTTKPIGKGTGLGLSISYSIIEKHGGEISVSSEVGQGTEFTITIPKKPKS